MTNATRATRYATGLPLDGLGKPLDLNAVDRHVRHKKPSAPPSEVQNETDDGLSRLGAVGEWDERFVAWKRSLDPSVHKISHDYVTHYDDRGRAT
jgi:hypothetical protein